MNLKHCNSAVLMAYDTNQQHVECQLLQLKMESSEMRMDALKKNLLLLTVSRDPNMMEEWWKEMLEVLTDVFPYQAP